MKQTITKIKVRDLFNGYVDNAEEGVKAFDGRLDIRPPYQREFVYKDKQRDAVINTINKNAFLGVLTWAKNIEIVDGEEKITYEVLDGQQRTLSICQYLNGDYMCLKDELHPQGRMFDKLFDIEQNQILDCQLLINIVEGNDKEKLEWFHEITARKPTTLVVGGIAVNPFIFIKLFLNFIIFFTKIHFFFEITNYLYINHECEL